MLYETGADVESYELMENALSSYFKGTDEDSLDRLRDTVKSRIHTENDRRKALEEIDELVDNANRIFTDSNWKQWLGSLALGIIPGGFVALLVRIAVRATGSGDRAAFREELLDLRSEIKSMKLKG